MGYALTLLSLKNDPKVRRNEFMLITKKEWSWVWVVVSDEEEKIGEDLKKHARSLAFLPGRAVHTGN